MCNNLPYSYWIEFLKIVKRESIVFWDLLVSGSESEHFENYTNPEFYLQKRGFLNYWFNAQHQISDKTFENIKRIDLRCLFLNMNYRLKSNFDYIRILSNLPSNLKVRFFISYADYICKCKFTDVNIKILQDDCKKPLYLHWKSVTIWYIKAFFINIKLLMIAQIKL